MHFSEQVLVLKKEVQPCTQPRGIPGKEVGGAVGTGNLVSGRGAGSVHSRVIGP